MSHATRATDSWKIPLIKPEFNAAPNKPPFVPQQQLPPPGSGRIDPHDARMMQKPNFIRLPKNRKFLQTSCDAVGSFIVNLGGPFSKSS